MVQKRQHAVGRPMRKRLFRSAVLALLWWCCAGLPMPASADVEEHMQFADGLYVRGLYDMAIKEYFSLLRDYPSYDNIDAVLFRIAESYRFVKNPGAAERFYKRLLTEYPDSEFRHRAGFRRAELYIENEEYQAALTLLQLALDGNPPPSIESSIHYFLGYTYRALGRREEARVAYRMVIQHFTNSALYSYACLDLANASADDDTMQEQRIDLYERAAHAAVDRALIAEALLQKARLLYDAERYEESASAYRRIMNEFDDLPQASQGQLQAAWAYHHTGLYGDALDLARRGLSLADPEDELEWLYLKANSLRLLSQSAEALAVYDVIIERFPNRSLTRSATYEKALIHFNSKQFGAITQLLVSVDMGDANRDDFYWLAADSYRHVNDDAKALQYLGLIVNQPDPSARAPEALYRMAEIHRDSEHWPDAADRYAEVYRRFEKHELAPVALFNSAVCLLEAGQPSAAVSQWLLLADKFPETELSASALLQCALLRLRDEDYSQAADWLSRAYKAPSSPDIRPQICYWLGAALDRLEEWGRAEDALREVSTLPEASVDLQRKAQYRLTAVLQKQQKYDEAADMIQALLASPSRGLMPPDLVEWLVRFRLKNDEFSAARSAADVLLSDHKVEAWQIIGGYLKGRALEMLERNEDAMEAYEQVLNYPSTLRESVEAAFYLAELCRRLDMQAPAVSYYKEAIERSSGEDWVAFRARSYFGLGLLYQQQKDWDAAARHFLSVSILFEDETLCSEALYRAASAFNRASRSEDAHRVLKELAERYPESQWNTAARQKAED